MQAFRASGCAVLSLASMGKGVPDLLVSLGGVTWLIEVKMPKGTLTDDQVKFFASWHGCYSTVRDIEGVDTVIKTMVAQSKALAQKH
jgi:hypothetical protein